MPSRSRLFVSLLLRSLVIQASWNYRTMIGAGVGFALLPVLRRTSGRMDQEGGDPHPENPLVRHVEHFNSHPYLAGVALGAVARMEEEGLPAHAIRRFKTAIRGPLGSMGDSLIWASWLPTSLLAAAVALLLGAPWWLAVGLFLTGYNMVHFGLRAWGVNVGLREGPRVAEALQRADLLGKAERIASIGVLLLGLLTGLLVARGLEAGPAAVVGPWIPVAAFLFYLGVRKGAVLWSWTAGAVAVGLVVLGVLGGVR